MCVGGGGAGEADGQLRHASVPEAQGVVPDVITVGEGVVANGGAHDEAGGDHAAICGVRVGKGGDRRGGGGPMEKRDRERSVRRECVGEAGDAQGDVRVRVGL